MSYISVGSCTGPALQARIAQALRGIEGLNVYYTDADGYTDDSRQRDDEDWADALARQVSGGVEGHYPGCSGREGECACAGRTMKPSALSEPTREDGLDVKRLAEAFDKTQLIPLSGSHADRAAEAVAAIYARLSSETEEPRP